MTNDATPTQIPGNPAANKLTMSYTEFLDQAPMSVFLWLLVIGVCLAQILDGLDFQATTFALPGIMRELRLNPAQAGLIPAVTNLGLAIGAIFLPAVGDRIGRRPVFQWVLFAYTLGTFLSAIAHSYELLIVARFIAGLGLGAQFPICWAILAEYSPVRMRHIFIPLAPIFFAVGWIVAALLSIWLIPSHGWRAIYWVGILPSVMIVYVRRFIPESVRFLLARGRTEEAGKVTAELARRAGMSHVRLVLPPGAAGAVRLTFGQQLAILRKLWAPVVVLIIFLLCSFVQTFGINSWLPEIYVRHGFRLIRSFQYTMIIFIVTPFAHLIAIWLQNRVNRKWALFILTTGGTVFFVLFGISFEYRWPIAVLIGFQIIQTLLAQGIPSILATLSSETFPTSVRTMGTGIVSGLGRMGAVFGPAILGLFLNYNTKISSIIYYFATPLFIAAVLALFAFRFDPRGKALEEIRAAGERAAAAGAK